MTTPKQYKITTDPKKNFKQLVADGKFDYVYTSSNYKPLKWQHITTYLEIIDFEHFLTSEQLLKKYKFVTFAELLTLAINYPDLQRKNNIFTLEEDKDGLLWYLVLREDSGHRDLSVGRDRPDNNSWDDCFRAAVKIKNKVMDYSTDTLVRDLTKVSSIPKSEAKRRILDLLTSQKEKMLGVLEGMEKSNPDFNLREEGRFRDLGYNSALLDIKKKINDL